MHTTVSLKERPIWRAHVQPNIRAFQNFSVKFQFFPDPFLTEKNIFIGKVLNHERLSMMVYHEHCMVVLDWNLRAASIGFACTVVVACKSVRVLLCVCAP